MLCTLNQRKQSFKKYDDFWDTLYNVVSTIVDTLS